MAKVTREYKMPMKWFSACYTKMKFRDSGDAHYNSNKVTESYEYVDPSEMKDLIVELADDQPIDVYMVGNSFGAPIVLGLANDLPEDQFDIQVLVTVDPISQQDCNSVKYAAAYMFGGIDGCKRAPDDYSVDQKTYWADRSGEWLHFWQTNYSLLHSSDIPEANYREELNMNVATSKAHSTISAASVLWNKVDEITVKIMENLPK
jgi:pimeloyl-ACP methyl ester carboxylesterase